VSDYPDDVFQRQNNVHTSEIHNHKINKLQTRLKAVIISRWQRDFQSTTNNYGTSYQHGMNHTISQPQRYRSIRRRHLR